MAKGDIENIRKYRRVPARIGRIVTYAGHPYRIASADGDALILKSELRVHPTDPYLNYDPSVNIHENSNLREIIRLCGMLYEMTTVEDWLSAGYSAEQYEATVGKFKEEDQRMGVYTGKRS